MRNAKIVLILTAILAMSACSDTNFLEKIGEVKPAALSTTASEEERRSTIWDVLNADSASTPV